jgi:disulfide bond formation protein DsbB
MTETPSQRLARQLALAVPALLLGGAYISEYVFGLYPCEMCWWQRWAHLAALALALLGSFLAPRKLWVALAGMTIIIAGLIGGFHAGVEYGWWQGITACGTTAQTGGEALDAIMNAPLVRCDIAPWALIGISLAGWNFLISSLAGVAVLTLLARKG